MSGCILWTGYLNPGPYGGYGYYTIIHEGKRQRIAAHRLAWLLHYGRLPTKGLELDHKCRVRCCVNVQHLEEVTKRENILRGYGRAALEARRTHCKNGHPLVAIPSPRRPHGRGCPICKKANMALWLAARRKLASQLGSL